jgi:CP family cyanate transporter-like MFS transporter
VIPYLSDRTGRRSPFLLGLSGFFITGTVMLVAAPSLAYAGALLAGIAQGGLFAMVMTLPLDFERTPARVGALVAMMLGLGYTIGATAPFILGAVRDATGSFNAVLWVAAGFLTAQFFALLILTRRHG